MAKIEALASASAPRLSEHTALIPAEDCNQVIAAIADNSAPASLDEAAMLGRRLVGSYPAREVSDGETFASGIAAIFAEFSVSIGKRVVHPVHGLPGRLKFFPTMAEIKEALEFEQRRRCTIAATARWMLKEHQRRKAEAAREAALPSPERRAELAAKARAIMAQFGR